MSIQGIAWAFGLRGLSPLARLIAVKIGDLAETDGSYFVNCQDLSEWCEVDIAQVKREVANILMMIGIHRESDDLPGPITLPYGKVIDYTWKPDESPMWIYVAKSSSRTKIGITRDTDIRMNTLTKERLERVELVWSRRLYAYVARAVERKALANFRPQRIFGEWFSIEPPTAIAEIKRLLFVHKSNTVGTIQ